MFLSIGEKRRVRILSVEPKNNRISISLLEPNVKESSPRRPQGEQGQGQGQDRRLRSDRPSVGRSGGRGGEGGGRGMGGGRGRGRGARSEGFAASSRSSGESFVQMRATFGLLPEGRKWSAQCFLFCKEEEGDSQKGGPLRRVHL